MLKHFQRSKEKRLVEGNFKRILKLDFGQLNFTGFKLFLLLFIPWSPFLQPQVFAQESSIEQMEAEYKNLYGLDKLKVFNSLTQYYYKQQSRKALKYGRQAVTLGENIFIESNSNVDFNERYQLALAYLQLGKVHFDRENYFDALSTLEVAKSLSQEINRKDYVNEADIYLEKIETLIESGEIKENFFSKAFGDLNVGETISQTSKDIAIQTEIKFAQSNEKKGDFIGAISHYEKAINLLIDKGDAERINEIQFKIAVLLDSLDQHEEAQILLSEAINEIEADFFNNTDLLEINSDALSNLIETVPEKKAKESMKFEQKNLKDLSESYARAKDFEKSLAYYKLYQELSQKMETDSLQLLIENKQKLAEILLLKQQKKIADLNVEAAEKEKGKQIRLRNTSAFIAFLILLITFATLYFYVTKRRDYKKLTITYRDLNKTKGKLVDAEQKIKKLLSQQLSVDVAEELIMSSSDKPGERRFVCIMFLDIRDFTPMAEKLSPEELIAYQNDVFGFMIDIVQQYNGYINQLLGDGFMAIFGAPVSHGNDCQNAFLAAKEILQEVKERSEAGVIQKTKIGVGLHAGYVVTGNIGNESRRQYSVTGNPVIIASRVEQLNKEYKSQLIITEEVYNKLDNPPELTHPFLDVKVKGRSKMVKILQVS